MVGAYEGLEYVEYPSEWLFARGADTTLRVLPRDYLVVSSDKSLRGECVTLVEERERFTELTMTPGSLFALTLCIPGVYSVWDAARGEASPRSEVTVSPPIEQRGLGTPYSPPAPARLSWTNEGLRPEPVSLAPCQGVVIETTLAARLIVELVPNGAAAR